MLNMPPGAGAFLVVALLIGSLPLMLLARVSHWTHATRRELQDVNKWLAAIHGELKNKNAPPK